MQELAKRGKFYSALEEAYHALEKSPDYIPLHLRLADMIWKNGQTEAAIAKRLIIANTLYARGDAHQAMAIYQRILRLAPMDVNIRSSLSNRCVVRADRSGVGAISGAGGYVLSAGRHRKSA
jgi:tetratricopeptide (TPR) repeat protein